MKKELDGDLQYTKSGVQKAGKSLLIENIINTDPDRYKECMDILSIWRSSHIDVLNNLSRELSVISHKVDDESIVVSRLKRTPSIITKLRRNPKMNLDRMQDIAGCRSIVKSPKYVSKVRKHLKLVYQLKETNYIDNPKPDGYRGVHLIGKHVSAVDNKNYQVEIQVRTKLQHAWATSVEIVDLFTKQTLKSNIGQQDWKDFFKYAGDEFANIEGTPQNFDDSQVQLAKLISKLNIYKRFNAFRVTLNFIDENISSNEHAYCLIKIDTVSNTGEVSLFSERESKEATNKYLAAEKESAKNPTLVSALVNIASVGNLKEAFPNYFADSTLFIETLQSVHSLPPGFGARLLAKWLKAAGL